MFRISLLVLLLAFTLFTACSPKEPDNLISEELYIQLLAEMHLLRAVHQNFGEHYERDSLLIRIFEHYNVDEEVFEASHLFYQSQLDQHRERLRKARDLLQQEHTHLNTLYLQRRTTD